MDAQELRQLTVEELGNRVRQWQSELFRSKFKAQSSEAQDTSVFKKLRRDIARGKTVLNEKLRATAAQTPAKTQAAPSVEPQDQPVKTQEAQAEAPVAKKAKAPKAGKAAAGEKKSKKAGKVKGESSNG